jgi:hypothetical protein
MLQHNPELKSAFLPEFWNFPQMLSLRVIGAFQRNEELNNPAQLICTEPVLFPNSSYKYLVCSKAGLPARQKLSVDESCTQMWKLRATCSSCLEILGV